MGTSDALLALRQAVKSNSPITYANGGEPSTSFVSATHIVISPDHAFPKSTPTRYRKPGVSTSTDPISNPADFFSLEAIYLAWFLRDAPGAEYMKQTRENGLVVGFVSVTERKNAVEWLEGKMTMNKSIVPLACKPPVFRNIHGLTLALFQQNRLPLRGHRHTQAVLAAHRFRAHPSLALPNSLLRHPSDDMSQTRTTWRL
jgi:hypothetical protein